MISGNFGKMWLAIGFCLLAGSISLHRDTKIYISYWGKSKEQEAFQLEKQEVPELPVFSQLNVLRFDWI